MTSAVEVARRFAHPPERVFDAWLDPAVARRFLFATPTGEMVRCDLDARVGGRFTITERRPDVGEAEHLGEYLEIDRPRRLVFTVWSPQYDTEPRRVTIEIVPDGDGCVLTLRQEVPPHLVAPLRIGWGTVLDALEAALG